MDKNILEEIIASASFEIDAFDGLIKIEGRILSPSECEAAGLASAMIASAIFKGQNKEQIQDLQRTAKKIEEGDVDDIEEILKITSSISPEQMERIAEREDRLLIKCVRRCSKDGGQTWEPLHLVSVVDQQNAKQNRLWVGMLNGEDRKAILDRAMQGHKEASDKLEPVFVDDEEVVHMYDIIGRTYGILPSEVAKLSWSDLLVCVQCVRARGDRIKRILKKGKRKKDMIFPNISIIDLADIL